MTTSQAQKLGHRLKVLTVLADQASAQTSLNCAAGACSIDSEALLVGLHIRVAPETLIADPEEIAIQYFRERAEGPAIARSLTIRRAFSAWTSLAGPIGAKAVWRERVGGVDESLLAESRDADLIVVAQPRNLDGADALRCAVFSSGRLVLFVPLRANLVRSFQRGRAAIILTQPQQTQRAVLAAAAWLAAADTVVLIGIDPNAERLRETASVLDRAGAKTVLKTVAAADARIIGALGEAGVDYVVMGVHRRNALLDWLMRGATMNFLRKAAVPVFLMH